MAIENNSGKLFKSTEEIVSMFLGLIIVVVGAGLVFSYFQHHKGNIDVPGVTDQSNLDIRGGKLSPAVETNTVKTSENAVSDTVKTGGSYAVKLGDNLWKIAEVNYSSGYNWVDIAKANKITNPGRIFVGEVLNLPDVSPKVIAETKVVKVSQPNKIEAVQNNKIETGKYLVVKGDSLWNISVRAYGDGYQWSKLWKANKSVIKTPGKLVVGLRLEIPERSALSVVE